MSRKIISLTSAQIVLVREAVDHITEFSEDTGSSSRQSAADIKAANGILEAIAFPVPVGELLSAAKHAANFLHWFEVEWGELTDGAHGKWPGLVSLAKLRKAIAKVERRAV